MNIQTKIGSTVRIDMSEDGEIVIPNAVRRAAGLAPGMKLVIGVDDRGQVVILSQMQAKRRGETAEQRRARIEAALDDLAGQYSTGQTTAEVMNELRGSGDA